MSLTRLIYYGAIVGGWAAFLGWLGAERLLDRMGGSADSRLAVVLFGGLVGAAIGAGLNLLAGMANAQLLQQAKRLVPGLLGGAIGGAVGAFLGDVLYGSLGLPRALGWMVMGAGIGIVEGLYERSPAKIRNGLLGGAIGGLLGGFLFDAILRLVASQSGMSSRATAFVILGLCIGVLIATAQVVFRRAWLSVVDGYRPKRELILTQPVTVLGRAEYLPLPFFGAPSKHVEPEHARITRRPDGRFILEDNGSKIGTILNKKVIDGPVPLDDGDLIRLGNNILRFHQRRKGAATVAAPAAAPPVRPSPVPPRPAPMPPSPAASPPPGPVATPSPTPAAAAPPRPAAPAPPPRPAAPAPPTARPSPSSAPSPPLPRPSGVATAAASASAACPGCGKVVPGPVGKRYCPTCHRRY